MNIVIGKMPTAKSKPLHPMRFILVMYDMYFHFMFAIFLFSGAKLRKKEIERNLIYRSFLIILTIEGLLFRLYSHCRQYTFMVSVPKP